MSVLQNAASVLKLYSDDCLELTVTDVARRLELPKANTSRLMKAMRDAGMLATIGDTMRHRPGTVMLDLAAIFRRSSNLMARAGDAVTALSAQFGHTGYISILDGQEVTAVADFPGTNALRVVSNIGRRLRAHQSATGRTILARMPDAQVATLYRGHPSADVLPAQLALIRQNGFATSAQESTPGVDAIAIAVGDPATGETVSLCIVYPHGLVDEAGCTQMIAALAKAASQIAAEFGDPAFVAPRFEHKERYA
ncbi:IclR family transcriptional regulator [Pseudorhodobacter sp.]|uniref:IclR family transcriptional regulator n=1 Tax=Pseudorhodobacter sp. TaxID=1934400 RepID=UPI002648F0AE|nr:IclR family transcriptional regulator [Pseudorhodobacter sp.]MDN5785831.1 IclR family transcriptional regulator [Pseudorhodobacter sp.]